MTSIIGLTSGNISKDCIAVPFRLLVCAVLSYLQNSAVGHYVTLVTATSTSIIEHASIIVAPFFKNRQACARHDLSFVSSVTWALDFAEFNLIQQFK